MLVGVAVVAVLGSTSVAVAAPQLAAQVLGRYTYAEGTVTVPADSDLSATATCPNGELPVGGGGYQSAQNTKEDINSSYPLDGYVGKTLEGFWVVNFNNTSSTSITGVAVAICAGKGTMANYSQQEGSFVPVPANGQAQATVTCPSGTVALGGGWINYGNGTGANYELDEGAAASAPFGTNGWRSYVTSGSDGANGAALAVCADEPNGWAQVSSSYVVNPANKATNVFVTCPAGTKVLGGGTFNSSSSPLVNIGLTTSTSSLKGWHSTENNDSNASESVDAWAVCADVT
jgi:hypothetical protein